MTNLFEKYDVPAPRYTSYPTVPEWETPPTEAQWYADIASCLSEPSGTWSLYIHLPFCESRCLFCGCNTISTSDHSLGDPYVETVINEMALYLKHVPELKTKPLRQLHLGGGSPTFLNADSLRELLTGILRHLTVSQSVFDGSVEVNPRYVNEDQLRVFREFDFNRISIGVQDFNDAVQKAIGRFQDKPMTATLCQQVRDLGFTSVNFDLIFGLPEQTAERMEFTAQSVIELKPDRIALYSLALVPWVKPTHAALQPLVPGGPEKRALYELCRERLLRAGYVEIGMDHFALPSDSLSKAAETGTLHRNFMGYTDMRTDLLLALGTSAISQSPGCFHQNTKDVRAYKERIVGGKWMYRDQVPDGSDRQEAMSAYH